MQKTLISIALVSLTGFSAGALAAEHMKPGLWQMTVKSDMMKSMPKIPPEQIEQMRKMGIQVPDFQDGGMTTKVCISKEMAERNEAPEMNRKEAGCEAKNFQRSGSSYSVDIVCDGPEMKGQGHAKGNYNGNQSFTSTYDFKGTAHGQPVSQHHETAGKWLSANCGSVKPMEDLMPKK